MERHLKITVGLLLLVQALHPASLQSSTDSPGRTIDPSWLRQPAKKNPAASPNAAVTEEEANYDQGPDGMASGSSGGGGIASGFMSVHSEEENNVAGRDQLTSETSRELTAVTASAVVVPSTDRPNAAISPNPSATAAPGGDSSRINGTEAEDGLQNSKENATGRDRLTDATSGGPTAVTVASALQTEQPNAAISPNINATAAPGGDPSRINGTEAEEGLRNSTAAASQVPATHASERNSTGFPGRTDPTDVQTAAPAPGADGTQGPSTTPDAVPRLLGTTESTNATTTTPAAPITPVRAANRTAAAGNSERGLSQDAHQGKRNGAWGAVLGIGVAVALIGLVAYVIMKKKSGTGFSHSKLVEDYPSDPVLRLDNAPPLDLNFARGGSAYYNPGLQKDNIQMDDIPGRR